MKGSHSQIAEIAILAAKRNVLRKAMVRAVALVVVLVRALPLVLLLGHCSSWQYLFYSFCGIAEGLVSATRNMKFPKTFLHRLKQSLIDLTQQKNPLLSRLR